MIAPGTGGKSSPLMLRAGFPYVDNNRRTASLCHHSGHSLETIPNPCPGKLRIMNICRKLPDIQSIQRNKGMGMMSCRRPWKQTENKLVFVQKNRDNLDCSRVRIIAARPTDHRPARGQHKQ